MRKRILFKEEEILREIERRIEDERLREESKLPSERQLAEEFGVQRGTVRCALEKLVDKGVIIKRSRQGYFVAPRGIEINLNNFGSILKEVERVGFSNRALLLSCEMISMGEKLSDITQLPVGTLCYQILRIRYGGDRPISLERSYLMAEHTPGLRREELEQQSLVSLLRSRYGISLARVHQRITQVYGDDTEAELLRVKKDKPLIRYEGLLYDKRDRLINYFDNVIIPDSLEFHIRDYV